nr:carbohydrate binding domain-containing protein [Micromonospora sp. DSM 115978]
MTFDLRFVDDIDESPTVRLDLNDKITFQALEGTEFGMPGLRRAVASTLLADGERYPAAAYDNRLITLVVRILADDLDEAAAALQALSRELDRPSNILQYRPDITDPVYFRTLRATFSQVQWDPVARVATCLVPAEPFALGLREDLDPISVFNDPADGPTLNANPYFEADAANWSANGGASTVVRSTAQFHEGAASLLLTPDGATAVVDARCELVPVTVGRSYRASAWARCASTRSGTLAINWYDSVGGFLSSSALTVSLTANTWVWIDQQATAPASATQARMVVAMGSTPPNTDLLYIDEARIRQAGGHGACYFDIAGVRGDVETPLVIKRPVTNRGDDSLFAVRRRGTPDNGPYLLQAQSMTQDSDTSVQTNSASFSGGAGNYSRVSFATSTSMSLRVWLNPFPPAASTDNRGEYRVFARLRKNGSSSTINVRLGYGAAGTHVDGTPVEVTWTDPAMADLGLMPIPIGADPVHDGYSGTELPASGVFVGLDAERIGGTDTLDIDFLLLVPADDRLSIVHWTDNTGGSADRLVLDSVHDMSYGIIDSSGVVVSMTPGYHVGALPMVSPEPQVNRIYHVNEVAPGEPGAPLPTSWELRAHYWPRFLYVAAPAPVES